MTTSENPLIAAPFGDFEADEARFLIGRALSEDMPRDDVTTDPLIPASAVIEAEIVARQEGVVSGLPVVALLFAQLDGELKLEIERPDGARVAPSDILARVRGPARAVLRGERPALNFLQHLSGIASRTREFVDALADTGCGLYDTRKTTPGWRALEKYAVRCGGGANHRRDLSEFALIKDNHRQILAALGDPHIAGWIRKIRELRSEVLVELEIDDPDDLVPALEAQPDLLLLDNFSLSDLRRAVETVHEWPGPKPSVEASGGVNLSTARAVAETGVNRVAVGALTHSAPALDIGLDLRRARLQVEGLKAPTLPGPQLRARE
jgi:nicotinate-nucleotide pyrophosphorylase (carboxylating)